MNFFRQQRTAPSTAERTRAEIVIYLSPAHVAPDVVPPELAAFVPRAVWTERLAALTRLAARYDRPVFERAYVLIALLAIFILPLALYGPIARALPRDQNGGALLAEARAVSFGVFTGTALLFVAPFALWKWIGAQQIKHLLAFWAADDRRAQGLSAVIPAWTCRRNGMLVSGVQLTIALPDQRGPMSSFAPERRMSGASISSIAKPPPVVGDARPRGTGVDTLPLFSPSGAGFAEKA